MTARLATCLVALTLAAGCGHPAPRPPRTSEPSVPPTPNSDTPPEPGTPEPEPTAGPGTEADEREVRSVVDGYVAAVTARDEAAAARYTCRKRDGSLLWVSAAGRPITVLDVRIGGTIQGVPVALVQIQVEGKPPSPLVLKRIAGSWCVWP